MAQAATPVADTIESSADYRSPAREEARASVETVPPQPDEPVITAPSAIERAMTEQERLIAAAPMPSEAPALSEEPAPEPAPAALMERTMVPPAKIEPAPAVETWAAPQPNLDEVLEQSGLVLVETSPAKVQSVATTVEHAQPAPRPQRERRPPPPEIDQPLQQVETRKEEDQQSV